MKEFIESLGWPVTIVVCCALASLLVQLWYYAVYYSRIPRYRQKIDKESSPAVSIVVVLEDDMEYLDTVVPQIMAQEYENFELVVVDNGSAPEFAETLKAMCSVNPKLRYTRINPDPKYSYRRKFVLNVGIKACSYPNIVFTESDCRPSSPKWLGMMAKGFTRGEVVIGYCGIEREKGFADKMMRLGRLMMSVRYLSAAVSKNPYRGISKNFGFPSKLYFNRKGYNYLKLNTGDDDLFVQEIAGKNNTSVIMNPRASVRQKFYGGLVRWFAERKYYSSTFKYYPFGVKTVIFTELFSRALFFAAVATLIAVQHEYLWIAAVAAVLLRYLVVFRTTFLICRRLGEKGILKFHFIHDLVSPFYEFLLSLARTLRPSKGIWS
ncbi:MAG: glycosyltransferase [Rikenellaceae bacterium]|nr:glycosyltransferase [Rikenellaceae bacterium]